MILARTARALVEVVLEIRVAAAHLDNASQRGGRERRATEIGMDQDAGRIENAPERRPRRGCDFGEGGGGKVTRISPFADRVAGAVEHHARGGEHQRTRSVGKARVGE